MTQRDEASSHLDLRKPCVPTTKANNKRNGRYMVSESMNQLMMIEGKVRESIYIVKTHTGATQRTTMTESSPRNAHATYRLFVAVVGAD